MSNFDVRNRQQFSLPLPIILYITSNSDYPKAYAKLIKCCKYFFAKNRVIFTNKIRYGREDLGPNTNYLCNSEQEYRIRIRNISNTDHIKKLLVSKSLYLENSDAYLGDILLFNISQNIVELSIDCSFLYSNSKVVIPLEKIFEAFPSVKSFYCCLTEHPMKQGMITTNTAKAIVEAPHFQRLEKFELLDVCETFNFQLFSHYMKTQKTTKFRLHYRVLDLSLTFIHQILDFIKEIRQRREEFVHLPLVSAR